MQIHSAIKTQEMKIKTTIFNTPIFLTIKPTLGHAQCCKILIKRAIKQKQKQKNTSLILA